MQAIATPKHVRAGRSWRVDPRSSTLEFRVRHLLLEMVAGRFLEFQGSIATGRHPSFVGSIRAASLETGHRARDARLRSRSFFDVEDHPEISFASTNVDVAEDGSLAIAGNLTIKETTRPIVLSGTFHRAALGPYGTERITFRLHGELDRLDYGLGSDRRLERSTTVIGRSVQLVLDIVAVRNVALEESA